MIGSEIYKRLQYLDRGLIEIHVLEGETVTLPPRLVVVEVHVAGIAASLLEVPASTGVYVSRANSHILDPVEGPQIVALDYSALGLWDSHLTCPS